MEKENTTPRWHRRRRLSSLTRRILAINMATLLIPIGGLLYLGPYRDKLIQSELEALKIQAETFAGAIGEGAIENFGSGRQQVNPHMARHIVWRLSAPAGLRSRLFALDGGLIADSRYLMSKRFAVQIQELPSDEISWIIRITSPLINWMSGLIPIKQNPAKFIEKRIKNASELAEVRAALTGEVMAFARRLDSKSLVLYAAVPVQRYRWILGALLVSKNDFSIKSAMREIRLNLIAVFGAALIVTVLLSVYLAGTLARPILRLASAAERVQSGLGRGEVAIPDFTSRNDEIGDLSGVMRDMTSSLYERMEAIERFAADVSHEIKNPLTSLRSAVETAARVNDPEQQKKLMNIIMDDVQRLDRLITDISDASRLDAELSRAKTERVDLSGMLTTICGIYAADNLAPQVWLEILGRGPFEVDAMESRLVQVFRNLIQNAISFNPPGAQVVLNLTRRQDQVEVVVMDQGPGLPEGTLELVFDRFYSERPEGEKFGIHSGLGLAISKQIVEAHDGSIRAENRYDENGFVGGARFVVRLPIAPD